MELTYLLFTGSLSGLISVLAQSIGTSVFEALRRKPLHALALAPEAIDALLHMGAGVALGMLFWLSWGLAAVVGVPWYLRGAAFGALAWIALVIPMAVSIAYAWRLPPRAMAWHALRWALTCAVVGLACAWTWQRM